MGWTQTSIHRGGVTAHLNSTFTWDNNRILDGSVVNHNEYYGAMYFAPDNCITMVCAMLQFNRGSYNFSYKEMSETSGPGLFNCPKNIFKALTPTNNQYATKWRERQLQKYLIPPIKKGDTVIIWKDGIRDGGEYSMWERTENRKEFYKNMNGSHYRVKAMRERNIVTILDEKGDEKSMLTISEFYREDKFIPFINLYTTLSKDDRQEFFEKIFRYPRVKTSARGVEGGVYSVKNKEEYVCCINIPVVASDNFNNVRGTKMYIFVELQQEDVDYLKKQMIKSQLLGVK
jgi:hypothetical protein